MSHSRPTESRMTSVTPLEPRRRRRDTNPPRTVERDVTIPLHRELGRESTRAVVHPQRDAGYSELALAARFFPLAAAVVAVDLMTKAWAATALAARTMTLSPLVSLSLAYNRALAGGVSLGENTRALTFAATGIVVGLLVMIAPAVTRHHRRAWVALALIAGAGLGNLASLAADARGVVDFIAVRRPGGAWVLNVADVALAAGLVLLAWTVVVLARDAVRGRGGVR
jgi:lipoprotein signal peptidase